MPITGLDRMPGSGLARGTLFDKELNITTLSVATGTFATSIILEKADENKYTITWTQPSGADRILSIPALGAADTFTFNDATQTLTNKALTGVTDFDMTSGDKTILDTIGSNSLTIGAGGTTVIIAGNLTVSGSTTTTVSNTLLIEDSLYVLNHGETGTPSEDSGFVVERGSSTNVGFIWDESADEFGTINTSSTGTETGNVTIASYANFQAANIAGTLTTAAQGNVTSLGTLTTLTVDDINVNGKVVTMTGSASDTAVFTVGTHGTLSIVTTDAAAAAANIQITADGTVDIDSAGVLTLDSGAAINIEPAAGSAILLDGTISVDAGVITGATSITSTAFVGTLSTAAQGNVTSLGTLTTLTVDNININGNTIISTDTNGDITLTPDGSGEVNIAAGNLNYAGTAVTTTGAELNLLDGGTARGTDAVASGDGIVINDGGTMRMTNVDTVSTYFASHSVGGTNIVTTGALDAGSITSNFGTINNGSSNITSTGTITYGSLSDGSITVTAWVDEDDMSSNSATLIPTQQSVKAYVDGSAQTMGDGFVIEDDDGTEVTLTESKEMKIIGSGVTTNWTDTSTGSDGDPYDLTITVDAAQTGITSIHAANLIIGEDSQTAIDFGTANEIDFKADNAARLTLTSGALYPVTNNQIDLGTSSLEFKDAFFDGTVTADAFAGPITGNVTGNASGTAATVTTAAQTAITSLGSLTGLRLVDDGAIAFGTTNGTDWDMYHDGSDMYMQKNTGGLMIGLAASAPAPDNDQVHIWNGSAGSVTAEARADLIIEDNGHTAIALLSTNDSNGIIYFGDGDDNDRADIAYDHTNDRMSFRTNAGVRCAITKLGSLQVGDTSVRGTNYTTGTASQSGTTVTGSGTTWTSAMIGDVFLFTNASGAATGGGKITARNSNTEVIVSNSATVSSGNYTISGQGTKAIDIFNGVPPRGALSGGVSLYSDGGELKVVDATDNITLLSPHDDEGYWVFDTTSGTTGKRMIIKMELMMRKLDEMLGGGYIEDIEGGD